MHNYGCSLPRVLPVYSPRVEGQPITNERVPVCAKFKSSTTCSRSPSTPSERVCCPSDHLRDAPGRGRGCARTRAWSSHTKVRRLCEIITKFGSPAQAKRGENFHFPPSSPSTIFRSQLSSLSPIIGQSQSELTGQSSTGQIDLPFCCAVSIAFEPFRFPLTAYHVQRRALSR